LGIGAGPVDPYLPPQLSLDRPYVTCIHTLSAKAVVRTEVPLCAQRQPETLDRIACKLVTVEQLVLG